MIGSLLVDPWVLSFRDGDNADAYVERLLSLFDIAMQPALDVQISAAAAELLEEDDAYPISKRLPAPLWPRRQDVYRVVASIVDKAGKIEDQDIAATLSDSVVIVPGLSARCSPKQADYLRELLPLVLVRSRHHGDGSAVFSDAALPSTELDVNADVVCIQTTGVVTPPPLGRYSGQVAVKCCALDVYSACSPLGLVQAGFVEAGIALALWQVNCTAETDPLAAAGWSLGGAFTSTFAACGLESNPGRMASMIRTAVSMISGVGLRATHPLRVGLGANDKQRLRSTDGAKAWRADIDDELHLHYWTSAGHVELASVVFHNCFDIPN